MEPMIRERIRSIQERIDELLSRFPAHSTPPGMVAELDELEEVLDMLMAQLSSADEDSNRKSNEHN